MVWSLESNGYLLLIVCIHAEHECKVQSCIFACCMSLLVIFSWSDSWYCSRILSKCTAFTISWHWSADYRACVFWLKHHAISLTVLTLHAAPTAQVSNVKVMRVNNSNRAALVSWTPLTLHQARGFPVYFVTYQPSSQVGQVARSVNTVNTTNSSVLIDDLDPTTEYTFTVDVGTARGKLRSPLAAGKLI